MSFFFYFDEQALHAGADVRLSEERAGGLHPQNAQQNPEPLVQQVRRIGLQVVNPFPRHDLKTRSSRSD